MSKFMDAIRAGQAVLEEAEARAREESARRAADLDKRKHAHLVKAREWVASELPALITDATIAKQPNVSLQGRGLWPEILAQACREEPELAVHEEYVQAFRDPDGGYSHDGYYAYYVTVRLS